MYIKNLKFFKQLSLGFTMIELLVSLAVLGIATMLALPSLSEYLVKTRTDGEIIELQRMILTARNTAINTGRPVTLCPLTAGNCTTNWQNELSVFTNITDNDAYDAANEDLIKVRAEITSGDKIKFNDGNALTYDPTGRLTNGQTLSFVYCPSSDTSLARGVEISLSGRAYITQDIDNDDKDEDRSGNELSCN